MEVEFLQWRGMLWKRSQGVKLCFKVLLRFWGMATKYTVGTLSRVSYHPFIKLDTLFIYYFLWLCSPARTMASSFTGFLDHTQRRATVGRIPLDE
jgi:hypothetical protein